MNLARRLTGSWCGVCPHGLARLVDGVLYVSRLETPTTTLWKRTVGSARGVDCASHEVTGEIRVAYTLAGGGTDVAYVVSSAGEYLSLGRGKYILLRRRSGMWVAMIADLGGQWRLVNVDTLAVLASGTDPKYSSAGLIGVTDTWRPIWAYTHAAIGTVKLEHARRDGDWMAGQGSRPASLLVAYRQTVGRLLEGEAREPKVCDLKDGRAAVIARVEKGYGVAFAILTPADVAALPKPSTPAPEPPEDDDDDEDDPMTESQTQRILKAIADSDTRFLKALVESETRIVKAIKAAPALEPGPGPAPEPDPGPAPEPDPDLSRIRFIDPPDVATWRETSRITSVSIEPITGEERIAQVCIDHTKLGQWPAATPETVTVEGCPWVIFMTPNGLVGCTYEWYRPGQRCKGFYVGNLNRSVRSSWDVQSGDPVGFMVSTLARDGNRTLNERSQIFWTTWP